MEQQKKIILLAGPTASGKSSLAIKLAQYYNGEIINADSMQVYKEISILTSKPSFKDRKIIKHHFYGFNSVKKIFSTGLWLKLVLLKIEEQLQNGITPIIVGGTGLYFKALTDGLVKIPNIPNDFRSKIRNYHKEIGQEKFFKKLVKLDPLSKNYVLPNDTHRTLRAYEVKKFFKKSLFELIKETKSNFNKNMFKKIFINTPKNLLHERIEQRVEKMFKEGAVNEVKNFLKIKVPKELSANKIIGISEIKSYLQGKTEISSAKELIKQKTKQYAKRQFTWGRGHMKSWEMIYSSNINDLLEKAINKIS